MKRPFFEAEYAKSLREGWTLPPKRAQENAKLLPVISRSPHPAGSVGTARAAGRRVALYPLK